jgi:hypothetical protein
VPTSGWSHLLTVRENTFCFASILCLAEFFNSVSLKNLVTRAEYYTKF